MCHKAKIKLNKSDILVTTYRAKCHNFFHYTLLNVIFNLQLFQNIGYSTSYAYSHFSSAKYFGFKIQLNYKTNPIVLIKQMHLKQRMGENERIRKVMSTKAVDGNKSRK